MFSWWLKLRAFSFWTWSDCRAALGLSLRAIAAEVGRSKTVFLICLKDPEHYGRKRSSGWTRKTQTALSWRIRLAVRQDAVWSLTQIKALTGADCSTITIRWWEKGLKNKKQIEKNNESTSSCKQLLWDSAPVATACSWHWHYTAPQ